MCENEITEFKMDGASTLAHEAGLSKQDYTRLDLKSLDAATFEVMSRQATINIGTIGHVAHGKSTVVKAMSGIHTTKYKKEAIMNITIHLGYANAKIFRCDVCEAPRCYQAFGSAQSDSTSCKHCGRPMKLVRHVSFVDCPGHDVLMATMLNGAAIMDAALLLIAANEAFPQPQTLEHLSAIEILKLRHLIVLQNKIDLVTPIEALDQKNSITAFLRQSTTFGRPPVIPICAQLRCNLDVVLQYVATIPQPRRSLRVPHRLSVLRSFDVNVPGEGFERLCGGVFGGSVEQGLVRVGDTVELRPGIVTRVDRATVEGGGGDAESGPMVQFFVSPLQTRIVDLRSEAQSLPFAVPGGLIAVGTLLDPSLTRQNKLCGSVCGVPGSLPEVMTEIEVQVFLLTHVVGLRSTAVPGPGGAVVSKAHASSSRFLPLSGAQPRVGKLQAGEVLHVNCRTHAIAATVLLRRSDIVKLSLTYPVCCEVGDKITLSRLMDKKYRLIGWGTIRRGVSAER